MHHLIVAERAGHAHIGFVTQYIIGPCQFGLDRRHHQLGSTGAQADHGQATTGPANLLRRQWRGGHAQRHAIARLTPGYGQQDIIAADKPQRHRQFKGRFTQRRTGHQGIGRNHASQGLASQPSLLQCFEDRLRRNLGTHLCQYIARINQ